MKKIEGSLIAQGFGKVDYFEGRIPGDRTDFQVGDIFTMPENYTVFRETIDGRTNQLIIVETTKGEMRRLYPSQLSRRILVYNHEGLPQKVVYANGTASKLYKQYDYVEDGMDALKGITIKVSRIDKILTILPFTNKLTYKNLYTFDIYHGED